MDLACFFVWSIFAFVFSLTPLAHGDTDKVSWGLGHSGISSATDALTGCQYLKSPGGGITKRLNKAGEHVGCER